MTTNTIVLQSNIASIQLQDVTMNCINLYKPTFAHMMIENVHDYLNWKHLEYMWSILILKTKEVALPAPWVQNGAFECLFVGTTQL